MLFAYLSQIKMHTLMFGISTDVEEVDLYFMLGSGQLLLENTPFIACIES